MVLTLALVLGATAGVLRVLDALPDVVRGEPRGVTRLPSIEEVERRFSERLLLPAYFPDTLRWPPSTIRIQGGRSPAVALTFLDRSGEPALVVYQSLGAPVAPSPELLPPMRTLQRSRVSLGEREAELRRLLAADGQIWHDVVWLDAGRVVTFRFRGTVGELLTMARSTRERS